MSFSNTVVNVINSFVDLARPLLGRFLFCIMTVCINTFLITVRNDIVWKGLNIQVSAHFYMLTRHYLTTTLFVLNCLQKNIW